MGATPHPMAWTTSSPFRPKTPQSLKIPTQMPSHHDLGVPIGGLGAGGITRGPSGGFTRFSLKAGVVDYLELAENGFALWQKPESGAATARALRSHAPDGWNTDPTGAYAALYPKAWHSYAEGALSLTIEQITPVAPGLEDDRDLPVGLFRAHFRNTGDTPLDAALLFSFANLTGWFKGWRGAGQPGGLAGQTNRQEGAAILMTRAHHGPDREGEGTMAIAVRGGDITACPAFDPRREGAALWDMFAETGEIAAQGPAWTSGGGFSEFPAACPAAALSARVRLAPGEGQTVDFALAWDLPVITFGQGRSWHRHYTARWGETGDNAARIAAHALDQADRWSNAIDTFHDHAATALNLPPDATALALNELYFLTDGLTIWTAPEGDEPAHFGLIECPDYPLVNTLDLWVYAAATIDHLFPDLARAVALDFAATVEQDDAETRFHLRSTDRIPRQRKGTLPHDLGAPNADPFIRPNDYVYQDATLWKDLPAMFVLTTWRSARHGRPEPFLGPVTEAMEALARFDRDGDGMIENDGLPDQTFDNIPLTGISAYCGGLWLAALAAAAALAEACGQTAKARQWREMGASARAAYESALWTGAYFRVDSQGVFREALFAEQLYGPATARMLGLGDVIDPEKAQVALGTIYDRAFLKAGEARGVKAMVSDTHSSALYAPEGEEGLQWDEILIGFNYSFAAQLRAYGMEAEARTVISALARELGAERGLMFRTPAAIVPGQPLFRAQMNLRPLGIFALADCTEWDSAI